MGYRSDVYILCEEKAHEMFLDLFAEMKALNQPNNPTVERYANGLWLMKWDGWKWYTHYYPEVDAITELMDKLDDIDEDEDGKGYAYKFIRLGEDKDDIEERCNDQACSSDIDYEFYPLHAIALPKGFNAKEFMTTWQVEAAEHAVVY